MSEAKPKRGEVWRVQLDPVIGSEQAKTRPVVVLNRTGFGRPTMRVCVPITNAQAAHLLLAWCVSLSPEPTNGLTKDSIADTSQIRAIDVTRFEDKLGKLSPDELESVAAAVALCIGYAPLNQ